MTRLRHRSVLWSARYPCQVSVPDSPPGISLPGCVSIAAEPGPNPHQAFLDTRRAGANESPSNLTVPFEFRSRPASGFTRLRHRDVLWYARYPCRVSGPDRPPAISLAGCVGISAEPGTIPHQAFLDSRQEGATNRN